MIDNINLTAKHIEEIRKKFKVDPIIVERSIFAFKLVENLITVGADFIFKGGTSLMVLLDKPLRFSTDVDIVVEPNYDIDKFTELASKITSYKGKNDLDKRTEVIKQMFDVASLFDYASDFKSVFDSYVKTANSEINYRNFNKFA